MDIVAVASACAVECVRQHVGLDRVSMLISAYDYAHAHQDRLPTEDDILTIAGLAEPRSMGRYRTTPVVFRAGGSAAPASAVASATGRLFDLLDEEVDAKDFTHAFLKIHPFNDGNGRSAFVLYNWLNGTLAAPLPLPEWEW